MRLQAKASVFVITALAIGASSARGSDPCDRVCLERHVDSFLDALAARDPRPLPLAVDVRSTENGQADRGGLQYRPLLHEERDLG
ncbi:MAG: hypothetical protein JXO72_14805 [Vicinamibacteria bacterium]|nr:hypothetical protein [Vicinamibacteria bacterium]